MGNSGKTAPPDYARDAAARHLAGHSVHTVLWEGPPVGAVGELEDLSDLIESVESAGWRTEQTQSLAPGFKGSTRLLLVFRAVPVGLQKPTP
ncbi:hypothetical protein [Kitasatospora sp. NPDC057223]|uniref:hypothetical protein n=1 Tax=Kitasatospora sp. NPDC057223 TaxID=3346055 RepID=UPI00362CD28E